MGVDVEAQRMVQLLHRLEREGVNTAVRVTLELRKAALQCLKTGAVFKAWDIIGWDLVDEMVRATIASHILGMRRSELLVQRTGQALKLSLYDDVIKTYTPHNTELVQDLMDEYGSSAFQVLKGSSEKIDFELRGAMTDILQRGAHVREGVQILQDKFDKLGLTPRNGYHLETLFRTHTQMAFQAGRWQGDQQEHIQEILWGYKYVTVGDDRVREAHDELDGVTLPKDDPFWQENWPPNGWSCRCQAVSILNEEKPKIKEPPDGYRGADPDFKFNPGKALGPRPLEMRAPRNPAEAEVHKLYKAADARRKEARANRVLGKQFREKATKARKAGDRKLAKELDAKAAEHKELADQYYQESVEMRKNAIEQWKHVTKGGGAPVPGPAPVPAVPKSPAPPPKPKPKPEPKEEVFNFKKHLKAAESQDAVESIMKQACGVKSFKVRTFTNRIYMGKQRAKEMNALKLQKECATEFNRVRERFPKVAEIFDSMDDEQKLHVRLVPDKYATGKNIGGEYFSTRRGYNRNELVTRLFHDIMDRYDQGITGSLRVGVGEFNVEWSTKGIMRHEMGHHVMDGLINKYGFRVENEWGHVCQRVGGRGIRERLISTYAGKNYDETFSEAFAAYTHRGYKRGTLPRPIEGFFDQYIRGKAEGKAAKKALPKVVT